MTEPWRHPRLAALLSPLGWLWSGAAGLNRGIWSSGLRSRHRFPVPVISVGNLTVGGTGKTPAVCLVLDLLPEALRPALVLARGYGEVFSLDGRPGNDEFHLLRARHPQARFAWGADRVAAAAPHFAAEDPPRCVVLDDGAQHLRIVRDLEILLFDLGQLLGPRRALPAGPWRESLRAGRGADLVLLTGAEGAPEDEVERARRRLRNAGVGAPIRRARHRPRDLVDLAGASAGDLASLRGRRFGLVVGIARPERVGATLATLGAEAAWMETAPDHRAFPADLVDRLARRRAATPVDGLLTTEKDAPKLRRLVGAAGLADLAVLRVDLEIEDRGEGPGLAALLHSLATRGE